MDNITNRKLKQLLENEMPDKIFEIHESEGIIYITYSPQDSIYNSEFYSRITNILENNLTREEFESFIMVCEDDIKRE